MRQVEALLFSVNQFGFYQKSRIVILSVILGFFSANGTVLTTLLTYTPSHQCSVNATKSDLADNLSQVVYQTKRPQDVCQMYVPVTEPKFPQDFNLTQPCAHGFEYVGGAVGTISSEFNLVCADAVYKSIILGVQMFFLQVGVIVFGIMSDKIGRKLTLLSICLIWSILTSIAAFVHTFSVFVPIWLIGTIPGCAAYVLPIVLGNELVDNNHRPLVNGVLDFSCSFFSAGLAGTCYLIGRWRVTAKVMGFVGLAATGLVLMLDESPRWLMTKGRTEEALAIIKKIARINGRESTTAEMRLALDHSKSFVGMMETRPEQTRSWQLFEKIATRTHLRRKIVLLALIYFGLSGVLYGVPMALQLLEINPYLLLAMQCLAATVLPFVAPVLVKYVGRTKGYFLLAALCGASCAMIGAVPPLAAAACAILARALNSGTFVVYFALAAEIVPTQVRSTVHSIVRIACSLPAVGLPFLYIFLGDELDLNWLGFAIVGGYVFLSAILVLYMPETSGLPLTDTIDESEEQLPVKWSNFRSNALWCCEVGHTIEKNTLIRV